MRNQISNYGSPHMTMNYYRHNYSIQLPSSRFKGVIPSHSNGFSWGAYILVNNQRFWLGNFATENDAAMAVDSASIKLQDAHSHRNFPWTEITIHEPKFQSSFDIETVVCMIRNGSYAIAFSEFLDKMRAANNKVGIMVQELFHKVLTPTDVGNNSRLIIPKKFAEVYFRPIRHNSNQNVDARLSFYDSSMKSTWEFQYSYCMGNRSYAFTRGWKRFVRAKDLKASDVVVFSSVTQYRHAMIDVKYNHATRNNVIVEDGARSGIEAIKVEDGSQSNEIVGSSREQNVDMGRVKEENEIVANETNIKKKKSLKIFGVVIEIED